jgi:hypothetical protein
LPDDGPPSGLINDIHSFGQLTSGCYSELIRAIYQAGGAAGEQGLWDACSVATRLLAEAAKAAPIRPRFLETVGRTMIIVDRRLFNGAHEPSVRTAFQRHGIALSVTTFLAPRVALGGRSRRGAGARPGAMLTSAARLQLHEILELPPAAKLATAAFAPKAEDTAQVTALRAVDLTGVSEKLADVKCYTPYSTLVGATNGATAVLGSIESSAMVSSEVRDYMATLVHRGQIAFASPSKTGKTSKAAKKAAAAKAPGRPAKKPKKRKPRQRGAGRGGFVSLENRPTHMVVRRGSEAVVERISFSCGCHRAGPVCVSA